MNFEISCYSKSEKIDQLEDRPNYRTPVHALWGYTLIDGLERWRLGSAVEHRWIFEDTGDNSVLSFNWVCDVVGIDPWVLRAALKKRKRNLSFFGVSISRICREG